MMVVGFHTMIGSQGEHANLWHKSVYTKPKIITNKSHRMAKAWACFLVLFYQFIIEHYHEHVTSYYVELIAFGPKYKHNQFFLYSKFSFRILKPVYDAAILSDCQTHNKLSGWPKS